MSANPAELFDRPQRLRAAFETVVEMKIKQREISEECKEYIDEFCHGFGIATKAFNAALKFYQMTDGERSDLEEAITLAAKAIRDDAQGDLFEGEMEDALRRSVVQFERKRGKRRDDPDSE